MNRHDLFLAAVIRVDRCDTCGGDGWYPEQVDAHGLLGQEEVSCPTCDGRGWTLPGWPWVKVPMLVHGGEHDGATAWYAPDPDWQPGATVTLTTELVPYGDPCPCDGEHTVPVGSAVISELVPVVGGDRLVDVPRPVAFIPELVGFPVAIYATDRTDDQFIDIDCVPGDVLARLEEPS